MTPLQPFIYTQYHQIGASGIDISKINLDRTGTFHVCSLYMAVQHLSNASLIKKSVIQTDNKE